MLSAQVNNQGYKQPWAFEESAAPIRYGKQIHQKDIPNVRVALQEESEWAEDKPCFSHTPTHIPCHPEITKLCSCSSSHATLCRFSLAFGTGTTQRLQKASEQVRSRGTTGQWEVQTYCLGATWTLCPPAPGGNFPHKPQQALSRAGRIASSTLCLWNK